MNKHQLTATLYLKSKEWPYREELAEELSESFFSIYNATRRESELYYLGYTNIVLRPTESFIAMDERMKKQMKSANEYI